VGPFFRVAISCTAGLAFAKITVEVEISIEDAQAAAFDESLAFFLGGHCSLRSADAQDDLRKSQQGLVVHKRS